MHYFLLFFLISWRSFGAHEPLVSVEVSSDDRLAHVARLLEHQIYQFCKNGADACLDRGLVRDEVMKSPWVEKVWVKDPAITKDTRLQVRAELRSPRYYWQKTSDQLYLIDSKGLTFTLEHIDFGLHLPVVSGDWSPELFVSGWDDSWIQLEPFFQKYKMRVSEIVLLNEKKTLRLIIDEIAQGGSRGVHFEASTELWKTPGVPKKFIDSYLAMKSRGQPRKYYTAISPKKVVVR